MFINIIQKYSIMGFSEVMSGIWEFFRNIFSGLWSLVHKDSREDEEKDELKKYLRSRKLTVEELHDEVLEDRIEHKIATELNEISGELSEDELAAEIRLDKRVVTIEQAFLVLSVNVQKFIHTDTSLENQVETLHRIVIFWRVLRHGLLRLETQKDINKVDLLFKELGMILDDEEKLSKKKMKLVKQEYALIMEEEKGTKKDQQTPKNMEPVTV